MKLKNGRGLDTSSSAAKGSYESETLSSNNLNLIFLNFLLQYIFAPSSKIYLLHYVMFSGCVTRIGESGVREWNLDNGYVERMDEIMELTKNKLRILDLSINISGKISIIKNSNS